MKNFDLGPSYELVIEDYLTRLHELYEQGKYSESSPEIKFKIQKNVEEESKINVTGEIYGELDEEFQSEFIFDNIKFTPETYKTINKILDFLQILYENNMYRDKNLTVYLVKKKYYFSDGTTYTSTQVDLDNQKIRLKDGVTYENKFKVVRGFWETTNGVYIGWTLDLIRFYFIMGITKYYSYNDMGKENGSNVFCVGYSPISNSWYGITHRLIAQVPVGKELDVPEGSVFLSHGYVPWCEQYKEEQKEIDEIKSLIKDGKIFVENDEIAKRLAYRAASATA